MPGTVLTCFGCGAELEAHTRSRTYCSDDCSLLTRVARKLGECWVCGQKLGLGTYDARREFEAAHQACRRDGLDKHGRQDDCRCRECKEQKGITEPLSVKPSHKVRQHRTYKRHRTTVLERDNYVCQLCGEPTDPALRPVDDLYPTLDHIIPVSAGGKDDPENLQTAHRACNLGKG